RANAIMQPFASMLSAQDMRDVGAHFATQAKSAGIADDTVVTEGRYEGMKFYEVGQQLYRRGDFERGIPACMACHGPNGGGNPGPAYPLVGGQQSWYTARRLQEYRAGTSTERDTGMFEIMAAIARELSDEEIGALSSYMQGLHKRPDAATLAAMAALPAQAAAPAPAPAPAPAADATPADADAVAPADAGGSATDATVGADQPAPAGDAATAPATDVQQAP